MELSKERQIDMLIKDGLVVTESETISASVAIHGGELLGFVDRDFPIHALTVVGAVCLQTFLLGVQIRTCITHNTQ